MAVIYAAAVLWGKPWWTVGRAAWQGVDQEVPQTKGALP